MNSSEGSRLSVTLVDVSPDHESDFAVVAAALEALLIRKNYGRADIIRDESDPLRYYAVRHWNSATAAEQFHRDPEAQTVIARLSQIARLIHVVNGVRRIDPVRLLVDDRRSPCRDRALVSIGAPGHRPTRRGQSALLKDVASVRAVCAIVRVKSTWSRRRVAPSADAAPSRFKVSAALEAADGTVISGCNVENATYGLTICAERVAMFKALSKAIASLQNRRCGRPDAPTPPCGVPPNPVEFGGNLEVQQRISPRRRGIKAEGYCRCRSTRDSQAEFVHLVIWSLDWLIDRSASPHD